MKKKAPARAWESLTPKISEWMIQTLYSMSFTAPTPVQHSTVPLLNANKDVVVEAVTGSGKTLAFVIPVIEKLLKREDSVKKYHVGALIISPTRELAKQIFSVVNELLLGHPPSAAQSNSDLISSSSRKIVPQLVVGGSQSPAQDMSQFMSNSPNLLIGTPGRLLELLSTQIVQCAPSVFEMLILDEADRLLDLGFQNTLQSILGLLPKQRRTGLFSASMSEAVDQLIRVGLRNPVRISVKVKSESGSLDKTTPVSLQMSYVIVKPCMKFLAVQAILSETCPQKSIIYLSTCAAVQYFQHIMPDSLPNFTVISLHGKLVPRVRDRNFALFTDSTTPTVLLTTNVAARGLDIPMVDLVIQFDPPTDPKVFIHRCGRSGRAGRKGLAITLLTPGSEESYVDYLSIRNTPIAPLDQKFHFSEDDSLAITTKIREKVMLDRYLHDIGQKAFVSWVQAYCKHQASSIFVVRELDWTGLGHAWGLLRLPHMPELKSWDGDRTLGLEINFDLLSYKDESREKHRLNPAPEPISKKRFKKATTASEAWSAKKDEKAGKQMRRVQRKAKKDYEVGSKMSKQETVEKSELSKLIQLVRAQNAEMKNK